MNELKQPSIDVKKISEAANSAAEKAYLKEIEDYYTSYNSPYRKMIQDELEKQEFKYNMELPHILSKINDSLSNEIDRIANTAIANTYMPMISNCLIGMAPEITLEYFLKEIIEEIDAEREDYDDFQFNYSKAERYDWLECSLSVPGNFYEFTLHTHDKPKEDKKQQYQLLSFPRASHKTGYNSTMFIHKDDVKIEMPFTPNILEDKVLKLMFKMMLNNSKMTMNVEGFDSDMFPEREYCEC